MSDSDYLMNELAVLGQPVLAGKLNPAQWCVDLYLTRCISIVDSFCWLAGVDVDIHANEIQSLNADKDEHQKKVNNLKKEIEAKTREMIALIRRDRSQLAIPFPLQQL